MATQGVGAHTQIAFELPPLPKEFGKDDGKFYRCYDAFADEMDDDMVNGLKEQLDGILIFAGLFAGVNSGFLALTLPLMNPDPADDTNALLRESNALLLQLTLGRNDSLPGLTTLPSETFKPAGKVLSINILFSLSLTFAIISSFMAVLGRQWLYDYGRRRGGGAESQRWKRLRRFLGTKRWHLAFVLDDLLPSILQFGLIIFCISLTIYLGILHPILSKVVGVFMSVGLAMLVGTAIGALWDPFCPFQTPLSRAVSWIIRFCVFFVLEVLIRIWVVVGMTIWLAIAGPLLLVLLAILFIWRKLSDVRMERLARDLRRAFQDGSFLFDRFSPTVRRYLTTPILQIPQSLRKTRQEESIDALQAAATKRVLLASDDVVTLIQTASNVLAIREPYVQIFTADSDFREHLLDLCKESYSQAIQLLGRDQASLAIAATWRYRAAVAHTFLSSSNPMISFNTREIALLDSFEEDEGPGLLIPLECIQSSSSVFVDACLGYVVCIAANNERYATVLDQTLQLDFDGLLNSDWRRISMLTMSIIMSHQRRSSEAAGWPLSLFQVAYIGDPQRTLHLLQWALSMLKQADYDDQATLRKYLTGIFKVAVAAVTGASSSGHPSVELDLVARLLHLFEDFLRVPNSPQEYLATGRASRRDLISTMHSGFEESAGSSRKFVLQDTIDELFDLLVDLTAADKQHTFETHEHDIDLASLLIPLLKSLDETVQKYQLAHEEHSPWQINVLNALVGRGPELPIANLNKQFIQFTSGISRVSRHTNRRHRDPDLRWCHREEVPFGQEASSRLGTPPYSRERRLDYGFWLRGLEV